MNWKYYPGIFLSIYASVKAKINPNNAENIAISVDSILFFELPLVCEIIQSSATKLIT